MVEKLLIKSNINYAFFIFYLGVFLLPSAFSLAAFLLLIASIIGFKKNNKIYHRDKINVAFLISSAFMIISCVFQTINYIHHLLEKQLLIVFLMIWHNH